MNNGIVKKEQPKFSVMLQTEQYKRLINNTLGDANRARRFVASISSAVATTPALQDCDAGSILSGALLGEALNLSPSPQLGHYYLLPFKNKDKGKVATFILGYKGYIQLAIRSGNYKKINVLELKEGELEEFNPLTEEIVVNIIQDEEKRDKLPTTHYYAIFEYLNGFRKAICWSKTKMLNHADKYSPAFSKKGYELLNAGKVAEKDLWKYSSFWYKDFDDMAKKTMLRQLISKWGVMSIEMREAFEKDETIQNTDGSYQYVTDATNELNENIVIDADTSEINEINEVKEVKQVSIDEL